MPNPDDFTIMRPVTLLSCLVGNLYDQTKTPVSVITLGSDGQVEQPIALNVPDTKRLVARLLLCLADLDDSTAHAILDQHLVQHPVDRFAFPVTTVPQDEVGWTPKSDPTIPPKKRPSSIVRPSILKPNYRLPTRRTDQKPSHVSFTLQYSDQLRPRNKVYVFGGYRSAKSTMILYRIRSHGNPFTTNKDGRAYSVQDGILELRNGWITIMNKVHPSMLLAEEDWDRFLSLPTGAAFRIAKRTWVKLSIDELAKLNGRTIRLRRTWK